MLNRMLNPTPTIYKWDNFFVGFIPAMLLPVAGLALVFAFTLLQSKLAYERNFTLQMFWASLQNPDQFLKISTLSCIVTNPVFFYLLVRKNYNNAARGVVVATMLLVIAIVVKQIV